MLRNAISLKYVSIWCSYLLPLRDRFRLVSLFDSLWRHKPLTARRFKQYANLPENYHFDCARLLIHSAWKKFINKSFTCPSNLSSAIDDSVNWLHECIEHRPEPGYNLANNRITSDHKWNKYIIKIQIRRLIIICLSRCIDESGEL